MKTAIKLFAILLFAITNGIAQKGITITGNVSVGLEPLIGAAIVEKNTSNSTITDLDGKFSLTLKTDKTNIVVSYLGYYDQNVAIVRDSMHYRIQMIEDSRSLLEEVVVTGYAPRKEINYTAAISEVSGKKLGARIVGMSSGAASDDSPENYSHFKDNSFVKTSDESLTTMSIDVDRASYSNVRRFLNGNTIPPQDAVRVEEMINYFDYAWPAPKKEDSAPFLLHKTFTDCPWNEDNKILHLALKAKGIDRNNIASNIVFLIDVSGSMNSPDKLPLLKESFKLLVNQLKDEDRVSIVVYAGAVGAVLEGAKGSEKIKILHALDMLEAGGSTAGAEGIVKAYELAKKNFINEGNNRVILATDGDFNVGVSSEGDLVRLIEKERESKVYLSILAFGTGNYQDAKMQQLADKGNGNHFYIDNINEAKKSLVKEFGSTIYTIANDVKIQIEFNPNTVAGYRMIGYENRQLENEDFNDDTKDAGEMGANHVVTVMYEIIPTGTKSAFLKDIDPLKYTKSKNSNSNELATIKTRYKPAISKKSIKEEVSIDNKITSYKNVNDDIKWSMAVAEFGLLLRESPYKKSASYNHLLNLIEDIENVEGDETKSECVDLIKKAKSLQNQTVKTD